MKIVHVLPALTKGGGERVAVELANHAAQIGHQVTLLAGWPVDPALLQDALHPEVCVLYVSNSAVSKVGRYFSIIPWLWRHRLWLANQDILHCHLTYGGIFGTIVKALRSGKQPSIVETYHAVGMPIPWLKRWFHACLVAHRDAIVLMAEDVFWCQFLIRHPDLLSKFIPNGISISGTKCIKEAQKISYRREIGIPENCGFVIGSVGRMAPDRKPWLYLPIFVEIARVLGPEVHFVIGGDGSELDRMNELVIEHGLEGRVHLPGLVLDPSLPFSIMDLYVTLNLGKFTGMAAMEAASSGIPVLGIQLLPGYSPGANDWIWSSSDPLELAAQAITLIQSPTDRQALAERQNAYVRDHHTTEAMARSYYALYRASIQKFQAKANGTHRKN